MVQDNSWVLSIQTPGEAAGIGEGAEAEGLLAFLVEFHKTTRISRVRTAHLSFPGNEVALVIFCRVIRPAWAIHSLREG